jgi:hypothetical protein
MSGRTVWKYPIPLNPGNAVHEVPDQARLVHIATQRGETALWYEVNPDAAPVQRRFSLFATGESIPDGWTYRGTTLHDRGYLVLHVYEADR